MRSLSLVIALAACGGKKTSPASHEPTPRAADCISPLTFGAVSDDGIDDRDAIQAAIEQAEGRGGGTVCLPSGVLHVGRQTGKIPSLLFSKRGVTFVGEGARSRLVMLDKPDDVDGRDWWVIQLTGSDHVL